MFISFNQICYVAFKWKYFEGVGSSVCWVDILKLGLGFMNFKGKFFVGLGLKVGLGLLFFVSKLSDAVLDLCYTVDHLAVMNKKKKKTRIVMPFGLPFGYILIEPYDSF